MAGEQQVLRMHGKTHCPGGSDPIPCFHGPPVAYTTLSSQTMTDGDEYTMGGKVGEFTQDLFGMYQSLVIWNDPAGATFRVGEGDEGALWVGSPADNDIPELYAFDCALHFFPGFDGQVVIYLYAETMPWDGASIGQYQINIYEHFQIMEAAQGATTVRMAGTVLIDPPFFDPDLSDNSRHLLTVNATQTSGSSQTMDQGWMLWTKLGTMVAGVGSPITNP